MAGEALIRTIPSDSGRASCGGFGSSKIEMARRIRTQEQVTGSREAAAIAATLGGTARSARRTRRWTIAALARKVGISTARLSDLERGQGARAPLETWISIGVALG
jgi:hypothetical protein